MKKLLIGTLVGMSLLAPISFGAVVPSDLQEGWIVDEQLTESVQVSLDYASNLAKSELYNYMPKEFWNDLEETLTVREYVELLIADMLSETRRSFSLGVKGGSLYDAPFKDVDLKKFNECFTIENDLWKDDLIMRTAYIMNIFDTDNYEEFKDTLDDTLDIGYAAHLNLKARPFLSSLQLHESYFAYENDKDFYSETPYKAALLIRGRILTEPTVFKEVNGYGTNAYYNLEKPVTKKMALVSLMTRNAPTLVLRGTDMIGVAQLLSGITIESDNVYYLNKSDYSDFFQTGWYNIPSDDQLNHTKDSYKFNRETQFVYGQSSFFDKDVAKKQIALAVEAKPHTTCIRVRTRTLFYSDKYRVKTVKHDIPGYYYNVVGKMFINESMTEYKPYSTDVTWSKMDLVREGYWEWNNETDELIKVK